MSSHKREINWLKVLIHLQILLISAFGVHFAIFQTQWKTLMYTLLLVLFANIGLTAGAHRLWAHNSYTASQRLKFFLMICHTLAGTGSIYNWAKLHRLHHKHFGTELDPYNPNKGFVDSHFTSFCFDLSPAQEEALKEIDDKDLLEDKIVMFQHKYYWLLFVLIAALFPINTPAEFWGESLMSATIVCGLLRWSINFHANLLIHSATKLLGLSPGEKYPADTNLTFIINKTYWISYHYLAPWDYQTGEYGKYGTDCTTKFIKVCEALNLAQDLRTVDSETVRKALVKSVDEKKAIKDALFELHEENLRDSNHIFKPTKFF